MLRANSLDGEEREVAIAIVQLNREEFVDCRKLIPPIGGGKIEARARRACTSSDTAHGMDVSMRASLEYKAVDEGHSWGEDSVQILISTKHQHCLRSFFLLTAPQNRLELGNKLTAMEKYLLFSRDRRAGPSRRFSVQGIFHKLDYPEAVSSCPEPFIINQHGVTVSVRYVLARRPSILYYIPEEL